MAIGSLATPGFARWQQAPAQPADVRLSRSCSVYPHDPTRSRRGCSTSTACSTKARARSGESSIRKVKLETGEVLQKRDVPPPHFGEGITVWKNELIELTWQSQRRVRLRPRDLRAARSSSTRAKAGG